MNVMLTLLLQQIVIQAPALALELVRLFSKDQITEDDWNEARKRFKTGYDQYLQDAQQHKDNK